MPLERIIGILGLLLIAWGIFAKSETSQDRIFIAGGIALFVYSTWLGDVVFMVLQIVFIIASIIDLLRTKRKKGLLKKIKHLLTR